ncbi:hypothetical protein Hte_008963 [Hypoxylon texense]
MDPLSILSIAAAAVQFLDFGTRIFVDTRETYRSSLGQKQSNIELSIVANDIKSLASNIESKLSNLTHDDSIPAPEQQDDNPRQFGDATKDVLIRLCRQAIEIGNELQLLLAKLQANGKTKLSLAASSFVTVLKGICSAEKVQDLQERLDRTQKQIMLETLVLTWGQAMKNHVTMVDLARQQAKKLDAIDATTRKYGENVANLLNRLGRRDLQTQSIKKYAIDSRWQPSEQMEVATRHDSDIVQQRRNVRVARAFAETLQFQTIRDREDGIPKSYTGTYEWIFEDPRIGSDGSPLWSDFSQWLSDTSNEIYWIAGKPGAGKSTLVKYIALNKWLKVLLDDWAGPSSVAYLATYYSWNTGSSLQKSHEGLLRTILYQCISQRPELLVPAVFPSHWALLQLSESFLGLQEWNKNELVTGFRTLLSLAGRKLSDEIQPFKLAIIIDGLDEFETEDHESLIALLKEASTYPDVKVCTSSRPWNVFRDAFGQNPMLQLENLTRQDIKDYILGQFQSSLGFKERSLLQPFEAEKLLDDIADRAQGVFLWVSVVVRDLLARFQEGDKLSDLRGTIDTLPDDLSTLFQIIWRRTNAQYRGEAAQYFSFLNAYHKYDLVPNPISFWLGDDDSPIDLHLEANDAFVSSGISSLKRRLNSRTRGLLDIHPGRDLYSGRIDYLHRTVKEWVDKNWDSIRSTINRDFDASLWVLKGETLKSSIINHFNPEERALFYEHISSILKVAIDVRETPSNSDKLVRILDRLDTQVVEVLNAQHQTPHWCNAVIYSWDEDWEERCRGRTQIDFVGLIALIPIPQYLKTKLSQNSGVVKSTGPIASALLCSIIGGIRLHPFNLIYVPWKQVDTIRLDLIRSILPLIPLDEVKSVLRSLPEHIPAEMQKEPDRKYLLGVKKILRTNIKTRQESTAGFLFRKAKQFVLPRSDEI